MKQRISPFQFSNYRDFLRSALKEKGFSYRSFAQKHGEVISFITLAFALSRGRSGTKNKPMRNLSPETLARLGKVLKLKEDEITFLILLKLENDSEVHPGPYGGAYLECIRSMIREQKYLQGQSTNKPSTSKQRYSTTAYTVAELLDLLPEPAKQRLTGEILLESKGILARQKRKAGVKTMASVIGKLDGLVRLGSP